MKNHKIPKPRLVADSTDKLREMILNEPPDQHIGSLNEVAEKLGVGIVTVQQAARILEHEGLLAVKRGPGGGYYGTRPDNAAIERAFATYLRVQNIGYKEAFELTVMLDCDIIRSAAQQPEESQLEKIAALQLQLKACETAGDRINFEIDFRETLFEICQRPLLELLARVSVQLYNTQTDPAIFAEVVALEDWKKGRTRILGAILQQDEELAHFEAHRFRRMVMEWMNK